MGRKSQRLSATDMRERLLQTAERLFASRGVSNVSLREITREAGANAALLHYHFGSKVHFYEAISERSLKPVNDERLRLLDEHERRVGDDQLEVSEVVYAWTAPILIRESKTHEPAMFIRLYGDIIAQVEPAFRKATVAYSSVAVRRFVRAFERALPNIPSEEVALRFYFLMGIVRNICTDPLSMEQLTGGKYSFGDMNGLLDQIVDSLTPILSAPANSKRRDMRRTSPNVKGRTKIGAGRSRIAASASDDGMLR